MAVRMLGTSTTYRMFISDKLLDLSITAIAQCSLQTRRFESLHTTIRCACNIVIRETPTKEVIHNFLSNVPLEGEHRIHLQVDRRWKAEFQLACEALNDESGLDLKPLQRLAILVGLVSCNENGGCSRGLTPKP